MDNRPWMEAAHPRLSGLPEDTVNEGGIHIRLFVKKNSLKVWPERLINN
jgi:hypothetical protein